MQSEGNLKKIDIPIMLDIACIILRRLIQKLDISEISIEDDEDFYWNVDKEDLFKVQGAQPILDIGRLSDDWDLLQNIVTSPEDAVTLQLIHLAPLLRWVGEKIGR